MTYEKFCQYVITDQLMEEVVDFCIANRYHPATVRLNLNQFLFGCYAAGLDCTTTLCKVREYFLQKNEDVGERDCA